MTIYLHCGGHKTASSFMKMFLRKNKALFESQKIAVHLDEFRDREPTAEDIIELAKRDYQNNYQQVIISEDANIIGLMPGIFHSSDRNFFNTNSILKFANLIARVNQKYTVKFLLCVRRQDTYLESCYKFRKTHGAKYSLEHFLNKVQGINISWYDVVNAVSGYIGQENCIVTPYEMLKKSQQEFIEIFFESILSINLEDVIIPPPNNQGASELMIEMIDYLDHNLPNIPTNNRQEMISIIKKHQAKSIGNTSLFSEQNKHEILQKYNPSNRKLFSNYIQYLPANYYDPDALKNSQAVNNTVPSYQLSATSSN
jgi:hypothetical protein